MAVSAALSPSVTGSKPDDSLLATLMPERKRGKVSAMAASARRLKNERSGSMAKSVWLAGNGVFHSEKAAECKYDRQLPISCPNILQRNMLLDNCAMQQ